MQFYNIYVKGSQPKGSLADQSEKIMLIPNWRTAIPGAPMDFLSSTTSSVITPYYLEV